ncbi:MAG: hypothetical protein LBJ48_00295 [Coriobacteriales bacterium]|nr:hypothetical protein [Coriobacteriales bacterium]
MANVVRIVKAVAMLAIAAFIVMVIVGIYTALDSATRPYALAPSVSQTGTGTESVSADTRSMSEQNDGAADASSAPDGKAFASTPSGEDGNGDTAAPTSSPLPPQAPAAQGTQAPAVSASTPPVSDTARTPSNGGSTDASVPAVPQKVWHEAVYETVHHEAVFATVHHDAEYTTVTDYYTVCHQCAFKIQGSIYPHLDATGHTGYNSDVPFARSVLVREAFDERVLVSAAYDEQVLVRAGFWE